MSEDLGNHGGIFDGGDDLPRYRRTGNTVQRLHPLANNSSLVSSQSSRLSRMSYGILVTVSQLAPVSVPRREVLLNYAPLGMVSHRLCLHLYPLHLVACQFDISNR